MHISVERLADPIALAELPSRRGWHALAREELSRHACDASYVALALGEAHARGSLWWRDTPPLGAHRVGVIGHYAADDESSGRRLLDEACAELARRGCTIAVGPMDGNTWRRYRLVTERGTEPPFFLEPDTPDEWPAHFAAAGFAPIARYVSALDADLSRRDPRAAATEPRLARAGVTLRTLDPGHFDEELRRIYAVSAASFRSSVLYAPISEEEFLAQYRPLASVIRPEIVLLAEDESARTASARTTGCCSSSDRARSCTRCSSPSSDSARWRCSSSRRRAAVYSRKRARCGRHARSSRVSARTHFACDRARSAPSP